jgi:hypothetical protein
MSNFFFMRFLLDNDSEKWDEESLEADATEPMQGEPYATFLLCDEKGPKILDHETANLLWHCGVINEKMLVTFSKLSIQTVLIGLTTRERT